MTREEIVTFLMATAETPGLFYPPTEMEA